MLVAANCCYETCLVSHKLRCVYAFVPKVACTSIKTWLVRAGAAPEFAARLDQADAAGVSMFDTRYPSVHTYFDEHFSLRHSSRRAAQAILADPSYFKFTFVRNPLPRLVSAYLDKVVKAKRPSWGLIRNHQLRHGRLGWAAARNWLRNWIRDKAFFDAERSLTFREFVDQLGRENQDRLDTHFRAQSRLLRGLPLDFVGRFEDIRRDFSAVQERLGILLPLPSKHAQNYSDQPVAVDAADWPAAEFRNRMAPKWEQFYDDRLLSQVGNLFSEDFTQFGYDCQIPSAEEASIHLGGEQVAA